jgi:4'-phosphopantetheinyl transferase EntD
VTAGAPVLLAEARLEEVPGDDGWLTPEEAARAASLRFPGRRADWRLGRWVAKIAVLEALGRQDPRSVEIRAAEDGAPEVFLEGRPAPVSLSLSHRDGVAAAAVAGTAVRLGLDVEVVEPRTDRFVRDYLTDRERAAVLADPAARDLCTALVWATKEAALKATRTGLRADTRSVQTRVDRTSGPEGWARAVASLEDGTSFAGWWTERSGRVVVVVGAPALGVPVDVPAATAPPR